MKKPLLLFSTFFFLVFISNAQISVPPCAAIQDQGCVGACNVWDQLDFTVPNITPVGPKICLEVTDYSLCGSHVAGAGLFINGVFQTRFLLTPGFYREVNVNPGDQIKIVMGTREVDPSISCVWLGEVKLDLSY